MRHFCKITRFLQHGTSFDKKKVCRTVTFDTGNTNNKQLKYNDYGKDYWN